MTDKSFFKRKRVTVDILSYPRAAVNVSVQSDVNEDKLRKIQRRLDKLESENFTLAQQLESSKITHDLYIKDNSQKITELINERNEFKALAIHHQRYAQESADTLKVIKQEHINATTVLRDSLKESNRKVDELTDDLYAEKYAREKIEFNNQNEQADLNNQIKELSYLNVSLQNNIQMKDTQLKESTVRELELIKKASELELKLSESSVLNIDSTNELQDSIAKDYPRVCHQLSELQSKDKKLENELKHYKSLNQNVEYLREERNSLQEKLAKLMNVHNEKLLLDIANENLRAERDAWTRYLETVPEYNHQTPGTIIYHLSKKADEAKYYEYKVEQLQKELKTKGELVKLMEDHMREVKDKILEKDRENALCLEENRLNQMREDLLKKHIQILQNQLHLYDEAEKAELETTYDEKKTQRIAELGDFLREVEEKCAQEARTYIQHLSLPTALLESNGPYEKITSGTKITEFLEKVYKEKEETLEDLREFKTEVKQHFYENTDGNHEEVQQHPIIKQEPLSTPTQERSLSPSQETSSCPIQGSPFGSRVLSFEYNPVSEIQAIRKDLLDRLQRENSELRQLQLDESSDESSVCLPRTSVLNFSREKEQFEAERESLLKRIDRIHEIWTEKLRDIMVKVQDCLGYKFAFRNEGVIKIESVYVDEADLSFLIKEDANEDILLRIVGAKKEEYLAQFREIYQRYVIEKKDIRGFLNAAALELLMDATENNDEIKEDENPVYERSVRFEDNLDHTDMEVDREEVDYNDAEEGYEESDHDFVEETQPVFEVGQNHMGGYDYDRTDEGMSEDDEEDTLNQSVEGEIYYDEEDDYESCYDDEEEDDYPAQEPSGEPAEICILDSDSE